jgi:hypothetical protein
LIERAGPAIGALERDTRDGTLEVAIPQAPVRVMLFPDWLLEQRKRVIAGDVTCYRLGVSNRRMEKPIELVSMPGSAIPRSARRRLQRRSDRVMARQPDEPSSRRAVARVHPPP